MFNTHTFGLLVQFNETYSNETQTVTISPPPEDHVYYVQSSYHFHHSLATSFEIHFRPELNEYTLLYLYVMPESHKTSNCIEVKEYTQTINTQLIDKNSFHQTKNIQQQEHEIMGTGIISIRIQQNACNGLLKWMLKIYHQVTPLLKDFDSPTVYINNHFRYLTPINMELDTWWYFIQVVWLSNTKHSIMSVSCNSLSSDLFVTTMSLEHFTEMSSIVFVYSKEDLRASRGSVWLAGWDRFNVLINGTFQKQDSEINNIIQGIEMEFMEQLFAKDARRDSTKSTIFYKSRYVNSIYNHVYRPTFAVIIK